MESEEFEAGILETAVERRPVLSALAEAPHHRKELQAELDISKTTCHRIVRTFDEMGLLDRTDKGYELTTKGRLVHREVEHYAEHVRAACLLEPIVDAFAAAEIEFPLSAFADATVTEPDESDPTRPVNREFEFFEVAETFKTVDGNQYVPPLYLEKLYEMGIEKGMRGEHITTRDVLDQRLSLHPDLHKQHDELQAQLCYRVHDDIPFGLVLYDDSHVIVRAYDDETGSVVVMADTDDPDAVAWAEEVVDRYREEATPPSGLEEFPDWTPEADLDI